MALKRNKSKYVILDESDNQLLDIDIYASKKDAEIWAHDIAGDCGETISLVVCELLPVSRIKKPSPKVVVEKL